MKTAARFKQSQLPRQQGERVRLKVLKGPDAGVVYVVSGAKAVVGRGDECDVTLSDLRASRLHAELVDVGGTWQVKDLGSANGVVVNGVASKGAALKNNGVKTSSVFEYTPMLS